MAQWVKVLAVKHDDLSSIPRIYMVERINYCMLSSDFYLCGVAHELHIHTHCTYTQNAKITPQKNILSVLNYTDIFLVNYLYSIYIILGIMHDMDLIQVMQENIYA